MRRQREKFKPQPLPYTLCCVVFVVGPRAVCAFSPVLHSTNTAIQTPWLSSPFLFCNGNSRIHSSYLFATSPRKEETSQGTNKRNKKNKKKGPEKRSKPRSRLLKSSSWTSPLSTFQQHAKDRPSDPQLRRLLTNYEANRNVWVNQERMQRDSIECPHFGKCSGCVVSSQVGLVDRVKAARQFFRSTGIRGKRIDVIEQGLEWAIAADQEDSFFRVVVPSPLTKWRTQAKLVVAPKSSRWKRNDGCNFGLYLSGSHQVLPIPNCAVHHPSINRAVELLEQATAAVGTPAFDEETRDGGLRYVQLQVDRSTGQVCLSLVWNAENLKETHPELALLKNELIKRDKDLWHSIWCHCNHGLGNSIFHKSPRRWHRLVGHEFIREPIPVGDYGYFYFSPLTFRQGNHDGFDILALDVAAAVPPGSKVCELYAGVGVLGLTALAYHHSQSSDGEPLKWLRCSDLNPANPRCFQRAVDSLPREVVTETFVGGGGSGSKDLTLAELKKLIVSGQEPYKGSSEENHERPKTSYMAASAADALIKGQALGANVLIVDPPRKGLEDEVLHELCKPFDPRQPYVESPTLLPMPDEKVNWTNDVNTLIYVSCGFDALARDAEKLLTGPGGWLLDAATGYVLFPGSDHVETVCVFKRN